MVHVCSLQALQVHKVILISDCSNANNKKFYFAENNISKSDIHLMCAKIREQ